MPVKKRKAATQRSHRPKIGKKGTTVASEELEGLETDRTEEEESSSNSLNVSQNEEPMTDEQNTALVKLLMKFLRSLIVLLESYSLKECDESIEQTILHITPLTRLEPETFHCHFNIPDSLERVKNLPELSYLVLMSVTSSFHGQTENLVRRVSTIRSTANLS